MRIWYHNDLDGKCAGAIAYLNAVVDLNIAPSAVKAVEVNYDRGLSIRDVSPDEAVVIVDYSIPNKLMEKLLTITKDVTWIDHHKTSIEKDEELRQMGITLKGVRSTEKAACELTWEFYHPNTRIPLAVQYIGDRDTWKWRFGSATEDFCNGLQLMDMCPWSVHWTILFDNDESPFAKAEKESILSEGNVVSRYKRMLSQDLAKNSFETEFEGHKVLALNFSHFGSAVFGNKASDYDAVVVFGFNGSVWTYSLYSSKIDVSEIAKKYGGGGHVGAAGFTSREFLLGRSDGRDTKRVRGQPECSKK